MDAWRTEMLNLFRELNPVRLPALRRSRKPGFLLATNLPLVCGPAMASAFTERAEVLGWDCVEENGWINLSRPVTVPPSGWFDGPFGPEAFCCESLLVRHGAPLLSGSGREEQRWAAALLCAGEEGPAAVERICLFLHRACAEHLRKKEPLPELSLLFFRAAAEASPAGPGEEQIRPTEQGRTEHDF